MRLHNRPRVKRNADPGLFRLARVPASTRHASSECHRRLIRTGLGARFAHLIRKAAVAATIDGICVGTVVLCIQQEGVVAVNVHSR